MTRDYSRRDDHRRVDYAHRGRRDDRDRSRSRDAHRRRRHDDDKRHHGDDRRRRDRSRSPVRRDERRGGERDGESRRHDSPRGDRDSRRDRSPRPLPPVEPPAPSPTPLDQPAKSRSGIFQYISELAPQTQPEQSRSQQPSRQEEIRRDRNDGLKPNAGVLRREIDRQGRMNAKMDAREREGANKRLQELETVRDVGRPTERMNEAGVVIKDDYSRGVHADVAARRDLPYVCEKCSSASFVLATQLSDHLLKVHSVHRHPSQIVPKTAIKA